MSNQYDTNFISVATAKKRKKEKTDNFRSQKAGFFQQMS
jgi:hypothetical protein